MNFLKPAGFVFVGALLGLERSLGTENLSTQITEKKARIFSQEEEAQKILSELAGIQNQVRALVTEKSKILEQKYGLESQIKEGSDKIKDLEVEISNAKRSLVRSGQNELSIRSKSFLSMMTAKQSPQDLNFQLRFLSRWGAQNELWIKKWHSALSEKKWEQKQLSSRLMAAQKLGEEFEKKESQYWEEHKKRRTLLENIESEKRELLNQLASINTNNRGRLLDSLNRESLFDRKGLVPWPIQGELFEPFGLQEVVGMKFDRSPMNFNRGIFIKSREAAEARSIFMGKVEFVGSILGLGETLVLDHGDNFYSVYANLKNLVYKVGADVRTGDLLGQSSFDPLRNEFGLYFELRHFSEPTNPVEWLEFQSRKSL